MGDFMIERIISGGQTGADQGAWRAAKRFGVPTGGWMPRGFLTETGLRPEFAAMYGAKEHASPDYPDRTRANVRSADLTIWIGSVTTAGYWCTKRAADGYRTFWGIPLMNLHFEAESTARDLRHPWMAGIHVINFAGHRESLAPGISAAVEDFLCEVLTILGFTPVNPPPKAEDIERLDDSPATERREGV
jgi:hypothetical protein